jgi:hypothetical protein
MSIKTAYATLHKDLQLSKKSAGGWQKWFTMRWRRASQDVWGICNDKHCSFITILDNVHSVSESAGMKSKLASLTLTQ